MTHLNSSRFLAILLLLLGASLATACGSSKEASKDEDSLPDPTAKAPDDAAPPPESDAPPNAKETPAEQRLRYRLADARFTATAHFSESGRSPENLIAEHEPEPMGDVTDYVQLGDKPIALGKGAFALTIEADRDFKDSDLLHLDTYPKLSCLDDGELDRYTTEKMQSVEVSTTRYGFHIQERGVAELAAYANAEWLGCVKLFLEYQIYFADRDERVTFMIPVAFQG